MQCNAMQCNAMQCNAMQCNAMQCNAMQCNAIQYNTPEREITPVISCVVNSIYDVFPAADFGPWSDYGACKCDLKQYRSRVCEAEPCVGDYVESLPCACVPLNPAGTVLDCDVFVLYYFLTGIYPSLFNCSC